MSVEIIKKLGGFIRMNLIFICLNLNVLFQDSLRFPAVSGSSLISPSSSLKVKSSSSLMDSQTR